MNFPIVNSEITLYDDGKDSEIVLYFYYKIQSFNTLPVYTPIICIFIKTKEYRYIIKMTSSCIEVKRESVYQFDTKWVDNANTLSTKYYQMAINIYRTRKIPNFSSTLENKIAPFK